MSASRSFGAAGFSILARLSFAPLAAQNREVECTDTPPTHVHDYAPEYREWDPGRCIPVIQEPPTGGVISTRALRHKPQKAARKEFDRGVQAWRKAMLALGALSQAV